jgi:ankyrin repeat protein
VRLLQRANRGHLDTVQLLIERDAPLEAENAYGGTILGATVWAAINEPKPRHRAIIEELLAAGACIERAGYPTGQADIDELLRRHGAGA